MAIHEVRKSPWKRVFQEESLIGLLGDLPSDYSYKDLKETQGKVTPVPMSRAILPAPTSQPTVISQTTNHNYHGPVFQGRPADINAPVQRVPQ